jgi:hypothetical protein
MELEIILLRKLSQVWKDKTSHFFHMSNLYLKINVYINAYMIIASTIYAYTYTCMCLYVCVVCVYMFIYIYVERQTRRERESKIE